MAVAVEFDGEFRGFGEEFADSREDDGRDGADDAVVAAVHQLGPFGLVAQRDAVFSHVVGFLLQSAAVGQHQRAVAEQIQHLQVAHGRDEADGGLFRDEADGFHALAGMRVQGADHRGDGADLFEGVQQVPERLAVIHVFGTMERTEDEGDLDCGVGLAPVWIKFFSSILHHIPTHHDFRAGSQAAAVVDVAHRRFRRAEEQVAETVGEHAVDFLGHGFVEGAQSGLDVRHADVQFLGRQRAGERGVGVAVNHHPVGLLGQQHLLDAFHHAAGERPVREPVDVEVVVGFRDAHLFEEKLRHVAIEMLSRVHHNFLNVRKFRQRTRDHGGFDELRPRPENGDDFLFTIVQNDRG